MPVLSGPGSGNPIGAVQNDVTREVSDCKFYCFHGDRGGREGGVEIVIFAVTSFLNNPIVSRRKIPYPTFKHFKQGDRI